MALSAEVRRQAMNAVAHKETTAQIRLVKGNDSPVPPQPAHESRGKIPEHVLKQAQAAVGHKETTAQIRLVKNNDSVSPTATPNPNRSHTAQRIAQMHKDGHSAGSVHQQITKDSFDKAGYG